MLHGEILFDAVPCSDPWVLSILRRSNEQLVWGLISLQPETATFTFSLPLEMLGPGVDREYLLKDLIGCRTWSEYGKESWRGGEFRQLSLTPRPFVPYFLELEAS